MSHWTAHMLRRVASIPGSCALLIVLAGCPNGSIFSGGSGEDQTGPEAGEALPQAENAVLGIDVEVEGQGTVEQKRMGVYLEMTATPDEQWVFTGWSGSVESMDNPVTILATDSTSISAHFVPVDGYDSEALPDGDEDGVPDEQDACPGTSAEETVNVEGCSPAQLDADADSVSDAVDQCPGTPSDETADENGCSPSQRDSDSDGFTDDVDACPGTPSGAVVLPGGCTLSQLDTDGDGVSDGVDLCPFTNVGETVDAMGCPWVESLCGNSVIDTGEQCDPPDGETCNAHCLRIFQEPTNDSCSDATAVGEGETWYNNLGTSTDDGPQEVGICADLGWDVWFCYTSSCTQDMATVSLCDSFYDTMVAVYEGCGCPQAWAIACDDDFCGSGAGSQVAFPVVAGESYMIRVGGWRDPSWYGMGHGSGHGTMVITCGGESAPVCGNGVVESGEACDDGNLNNGDGCDSNCTITACGNGITTTGEECDDGGQSAACDVDCTAATCGDGTLNTTAGEQCEPPNTDTCDADCQTITTAETTTWMSSQFLFGYLAEFLYGSSFYVGPETYELDNNGNLVAAHVTLDTAVTQAVLEGNVTVLATSLSPGVQTQIFRVDHVFGEPGSTLTDTGIIHAFTLSIEGSNATWTFNYSLTEAFQVPSGTITLQYHFVGQQTGTVSGGGTQITWTSVTGTATFCDEIYGCLDGPLEDIGLPLGSWWH